MKMIKNIRAKLNMREIVQYLISGGAWFWTGYILIVVLDGPLGELYGESQGLFLANLIGNGVGITINFILQRYWVFRGNKTASSFGKATTRYVVYTALNAFLLNYLILLGLKNIGIEPEFGQFIAAGFFTVWNYFWYKWYVFKGMSSVKVKV